MQARCYTHHNSNCKVQKLVGGSYASCGTQVCTLRVASAGFVRCVGCRHHLFLYKHIFVCTNFNLFACLCSDLWIAIIHSGNFLLRCTAAGGDHRFMAIIYGTAAVHHAAGVGRDRSLYPLAGAHVLVGLSAGVQYGLCLAYPTALLLATRLTILSFFIILIVIKSLSLIVLTHHGRAIAYRRVKSYCMRKVRTPCE